MLCVPCRYYEMRMTLEDTEVMEEITYTNHKTGERIRQVLRGGSAAKHEALTTEQLTSSSQEEKKRFIIQSIVDPRDLSEMSMREAMAAGVIDPERGLYVNPATGESKSIPLAMNEGLIRVEYVSTRKTVEKTKAVGLITIRTLIDRRGYTVTGAIDATTAERVDAEEAHRRGLIDQQGGCYIIGTTGEKLPLLDAIDEGWVFAEFEPETGNVDTEVNTYAVSEVEDPYLKTRVSFAEAMRKGLIDRETGDYVNRLTRQRVYVVDAIRQGLLRARLVQDTKGLNISTANNVVVDRIQKIKKNVLKGLRVINAFKSSAATTKE